MDVDLVRGAGVRCIGFIPFAFLWHFSLVLDLLSNISYHFDKPVIEIMLQLLQIECDNILHYSLWYLEA